MQALSDTTLLDIWACGHRRELLAQAALLTAATPEHIGTAPEMLTVGERDATLLRLRGATFGTRFVGSADCPVCYQRMEFDFDAAAMMAELRPPLTREFTTQNGLRFKLPDCQDLHALALGGDIDLAARQLLQRCCLENIATTDWNDDLVAEVEAHIATLDSAADIRLLFCCIACAHEWNQRLDIAAWFWDEIELRAQRLLDEVHCLASAYGWSEAQILALGDTRRRSYLERLLT